MLKAFIKNWRLKSVRKKIDQMTKEILTGLKNREEYEPIEYGNLRKGEYWGDALEGKILWSFVIDVSLGKPIQYIISYNPENMFFDCYAKTSVNNFLSVLQFTTREIGDLYHRLKELAEHIPSLRERSLREYVFAESKRAPRRRWYKPFVSSQAKAQYLQGILNEMKSQNKISAREGKRLENYIHDLC